MARGWGALLVVAALGLAGCGNEVPILLYHWVGADSGLPWDIAPERFAAHMDELKRLGYETVTLAELDAAEEGRGELPENPVVLSFDDGEAGDYRHAFPILRERGLRAEIFVVSDFMREADEERHLWVQGGRPLQMLRWTELQEMAEAGTFAIQSHSRTHPALNELPLEEARRQIAESRARISTRLGLPVDYFAYPGYKLNAEVIEAVEEAGYRGAVGGANRIGGRWARWRLAVHFGDDPAMLREKLRRGWVDAY